MTDEIKIQTLANVEDSMFGHDLLDVRINGLPLPIHGYKLDWQNVLIDGNYVGLFYSQPGECHQHFALLEYHGDEASEEMAEDVHLLYELKLESWESFEVLQNS